MAVKTDNLSDTEKHVFVTSHLRVSKERPYRMKYVTIASCAVKPWQCMRICCVEPMCTKCADCNDHLL